MSRAEPVRHTNLAPVIRLMTPGDELTRTTFRTSRLLDFLSEKELTAQTGYPREAWPLVIAKELVDNALDACEEQRIAPEITVTVDETGITVADNGRGMPTTTVDGLVDFSIRVSSREAYVAPDRGAQGNALKTIVAMTYVLGGDAGRVDIAGDGSLSEVRFTLDRIRQQPLPTIARSEHSGSFVRVHLPEEARGLVTRTEGWFVQLLVDFAVINPHLTLHISWFDDDPWSLQATDPFWTKWRPSDPTSPHWYRPEDFERLIAAYLRHDLDAGRSSRTVREFVSEFRGLARSGSQKQVLDTTGLAREQLSALAPGGVFDHERIARLLDAMQFASRPVKPAALGIIGEEHVRESFESMGVDMDSFAYRKVLTRSGDLPQVVEVAFGAFSDDQSDRLLVSGVNWSGTFVNPFRYVGPSGLEAWLVEEARAGEKEPVAILVHVAQPRIQHSDRGKSAVVGLPGTSILDGLKSVTSRWAKQRKAEERDAARALNRAAALRGSSSLRPINDICEELIEPAYLQASDGGTLPTFWRQVMYRARALFSAHPDAAGRPLDADYFKRVLEDYLARHRPGWDILFGARGTLKEPHTDRLLPLSTMDVRTYLADAQKVDLGTPHLPTSYPTVGAGNRMAAVLICEKEGFDELLQASGIPARYDVALMSTKGISARAARDLAAALDVPRLVLHDFDKNGFVMAAGFRGAVDIGLRLDDITDEGLPFERHRPPPANPKQIASARTEVANLRKNGATTDEARIIAMGERVELNELTGRALIAFVERKLDEQGITKVVPDEATLASAWRRARLQHRINGEIDRLSEEEDTEPVPPDLEAQIRSGLDDEPELPWDEVMARLTEPPEDQT